MSSEKTKHRQSFNTIGFRLTLWGGGITIFVCFLVCTILYVGLWLSLRHEVDGVLEGEVHELTASIFQEHGHDYQAAEKGIALELSHRLRGDLSFRLLDAQGNVLVNGDPEHRLDTIGISAFGKDAGASAGTYQTIAVPGQQYPIRVCIWRFHDDQDRSYIAQAGYLLDRVTASSTRFLRICIAALCLAGVASFVGGRMVANRSLRPIQTMTAKAQRINALRIEDRLPRSRTGDELDQLAETLNSMLDRIQRYVTQLRQFTADASHELRSPLAALRGSAEVALTRDRPSAELKKVIEESIEHYDRLTRLADDLLMLARADAGQLSLRRENIQLDRAIADMVDLYGPLAKEQGIELIFADRREIWLEADNPRIRQLIGNLVDNAIKYVGSGNEVTISLSRENNTATVLVTDDGPGISPDHLAHIFDRFYRVDRARSGQGPGGAGLGLSICRTIAEAHGGTIDISSTPGEGTSVSILLPLYRNTKEPHLMPL